jgi:hypothetical protein
MSIPVNKLTKFRVSRGSVGNNRFSSFTYVGPCTKEKCSAYEICTYEKKGSCSAMRAYLVVAYVPMERLMRIAKDPVIISHWVGQLLSAYLKLAKFEIKEMSLRDPIYKTNKGDLKVHPIYELIQKQQKLIYDLWVRSGMMKMAKKAGLMEIESLIPGMDDIVQDGQPGYYDAMLRGDNRDIGDIE